MLEKSMIRDSNRNIYPLITTVIGSLAFILVEEAFMLLIPGVSSRQILAVYSIIVPVAIVIMFTVLGMVQKNKLILLIIYSEVGFWVSIIFGFSISGLFELTSFDPPDYLAYPLFAIGFGLFLAMFFFGKEAILHFVVVCGLVAIPCGLLVDVGVNEYLTISIVYGTSVGLSVGLYKRRNKKTITIAAVIIVITTMALLWYSYWMNA